MYLCALFVTPRLHHKRYYICMSVCVSVCIYIYLSYVRLANQLLQPATHEVSAGHFGQHLRQARERHGDIGQVLGHGAVHDAE